jgi:DNA helicase-2/ATP-dependent DNA helicase PcrA
MNIVYTPDQQAAIDHRGGNLLILACAGSGKTEVLANRIAKLVREGTSKASVIAFTFTERAAGELKARIRRHLDALCPDDPSLGDMYVGTIHSFCLQLLKELDPGYRKYEVMDEARQAALIMTRFRRFADGEGIGLDLLRSRTRSNSYTETVGTFLRTLNVVHQKGIDPDTLTDPELRQAIEAYRREAYGPPNFFFDFDHIVGELIRVLRERPAKLEDVRGRFKHLIVDEYQDVDDRQEGLIRLLTDTGRRVSVTAVGDDDQAIYGWRGADIRNILQFPTAYPQVRTITVDYNFRSTHAIVDIANAAIRKIAPGDRTPKSMEARHWTGVGFEETLADFGDIQVRRFSDENAEVEWVVDQIQALRGTKILERGGAERGIDWADMAILLRSVKSAGRPFAAALRERGVPAVVRGTRGLFDHDEVVLIQAAFCLLARADFLIEGQDGRMQALGEAATRDFIRAVIARLRALNLMPDADAAVFLEWIASERARLDRRNLEREERGRLARRIYPQELFQDMMRVLGSAKGAEPWPQSVLYNLGRLSSLITQFEAVHQWVTPAKLHSLCVFLGGWAAGNVDEGGIDEVVSPNAVQIMTIHAAKGLEWPVVFVPRVSSSNFPSSYRNRGPETFLPSSLFNPAEYAAGDNGERRLWYVALTRCRKFLHITSPDRPRKKPTEYFKAISHDRVQTSGQIAERDRTVPTVPANADLLPTTFSDLNYWWRCPFEYELRTLMSFGPGVKESYGYGQQIHNVLVEVHERAKAGERPTVEEVLELVDRRFHLRYTRDGETYKPFTQLREAAKLSLQRYLRSYPEWGAMVFEAEKPFEFVDHESGALISGTIDLLRAPDDSDGVVPRPVSVVDFKAHRWRNVSSFESARANVEMQLQMYAVAARRALNLDPQIGQAHFLNPHEPPEELRRQGVSDLIEIDVSPVKQEEVRRRVSEAVQGIRSAIETRDFPLKGCLTGACRTCDYREFCPGFRRWKATEKTKPLPRTRDEEREREAKFIEEDVGAGNTSE